MKKKKRWKRLNLKWQSINLAKHCKKAMENAGYVVYSGKGIFIEKNMFQVANMGEIYPEDCKEFLGVLADCLK